MATCTVSGTFLDPSGTAISGATVSFTIEQPVLDASSRLLLPKTISTTTATDGTWSLAIVQSVSGILSLKLAPIDTSAKIVYNFSLIIPTTTTATFQSCWADSNTFTPASDAPISFADITGQLSTAQLPTLADAKIWVGNSSSAATAVSVSGDVTLADTGAITVATVGTSTASNVHTAELTVNTAQSGNKVLASPADGSSAAPSFRALVGADLPAPTSTTLGGIKSQAAQSSKYFYDLDTSGNLSAKQVNFNELAGSASAAQLPSLTLTGDVTATISNGTGAATVASVGGSTSTLVHSAELAANAATNANTVSTIVKRDSSGNFSAGTITASVTGHASLDLAAASNLSDVGTKATAFNNISPVTSTGDLIVGDGTNSNTRLAKGTQYQTLQTGAATLGYDAVHLDQAAAVTGTLPNGNTTAASANTASAIVARDGSGNFSAGTITAALTGTASGNTTYSANNHGVVVSGSANTMTVIAPDASATKVLKSGGASADPSWLAYDNANTVSTLVFRDSSGNFSAGTVTAALTGTASGNTAYTANNHGVVVSGSGNTMTVIAPDSSTTKFLKSGGSSADPSWAAISTALTAPTVQKFTSTGTTAGYSFVVTAANATVGATYTNNGNTYTVLNTIAGATRLFCSNASAPQASGTLTKATGSGDATISFSSANAYATYTTPANVLYVRVRMVGGGGGGGGSGTANGSDGGSAGESAFGANSLLASGGAGGSHSSGNGGAGGGFSLGSLTGLGFTGAQGQGETLNPATNPSGTSGGEGGASVFGGRGAGQENSAGQAAATNTGSGGAGGGGNAASLLTGGGGGAGGYVEAIITSPAATYPYLIGTAGSAGSAGTSGQAGGAGAAGIIYVEEFYQ